MLKKVMSLVASKYLAIKVRIRAIETHVMIQSLLLRDKKMVRHLFQQRKCFNLSNKVKDEDERKCFNLSNKVEVEYHPGCMDGHNAGDEDYLSESNGSVGTARLINSSIAATPVSNSMVEEEECVSVIEMVKNAKEGRGQKFVLEEDIDKVADLFIQRFHHQILRQRNSD